MNREYKAGDKIKVSRIAGDVIETGAEGIFTSYYTGGVLCVKGSHERAYYANERYDTVYWPYHCAIPVAVVAEPVKEVTPTKHEPVSMDEIDWSLYEDFRLVAMWTFNDGDEDATCADTLRVRDGELQCYNEWNDEWEAEERNSKTRGGSKCHLYTAVDGAIVPLDLTTKMNDLGSLIKASKYKAAAPLFIALNEQGEFTTEEGLEAMINDYGYIAFSQVFEELMLISNITVTRNKHGV